MFTEGFWGRGVAPGAEGRARAERGEGPRGFPGGGKKGDVRSGDDIRDRAFVIFIIFRGGLPSPREGLGPARLAGTGRKPALSELPAASSGSSRLRRAGSALRTTESVQGFPEPSCGSVASRSVGADSASRLVLASSFFFRVLFTLFFINRIFFNSVNIKLGYCAIIVI